MQINKSSRKRLEKQLKKWKNTGETSEGSPDESSTSSFDETYDANKLEMLDLEVQDLVEELDQRGEALINHPTPTHIREYQQVLASFLDKSLSLSKEIQRIKGKRNLKDIQEGNEQKEHVIVSTIDEKVDELANKVLNEQEREIELAERVGEIQGLVVDLMSTLETREPELDNPSNQTGLP